MAVSGDSASLAFENDAIAAHLKQLHAPLLHNPQQASVSTVTKVLSEPLSLLGFTTGGPCWSGPKPTVEGRMYFIQYLLPHHINFILDHIVLDWLSALPVTVQSSCFNVYFAPSGANDLPGDADVDIPGCVHLMAIQTLMDRLTASDFSNNHSFVNSVIFRQLRANITSLSLLSRWRAVAALYSRGRETAKDIHHRTPSPLLQYWQDFITRLFSIPTRAANAVGQNFTSLPDEFQDRLFFEHQSKLLIEAAEQIGRHFPDETLTTQALTIAMSKLIVLGQTDIFVTTLLGKTLDPAEGFIGDQSTMTIWKSVLGSCSTKVVSSIFASILRWLSQTSQGFSTDANLTWYIQQCAIFLSRLGYGPDTTLGNAVVEDALSFGKTYSTIVVRVLICLQSGWPDQKGKCNGVLAKSFKRALSIWSDAHFIRNSVPDYQRLEQMLVIIGYLGANILDEEGTEAIFWSGMSEWLNLTNFDRKKLGLVLAEEVSKVVIETGKPVDFELDNSDSDINFLRSLTQLRDGQQAVLKHPSSDVKAAEREFDPISPEETASQTTTSTQANVGQDSEDEEDPDAVVDQFARLETSDISGRSNFIGLHGNITDEDDEDEDDLKPYAMEEESDPDEELGSLNKPKINPPIFLRDLNQYLRASEDREKAEIGLAEAENLIRKKAGSLELDEYAERIASTLVTLQDSFEIPKFTEMREKALIALIVTSPLVVVRLLTTKFYEKSLSLGQRLTILSALGIAAQELSGHNVISEAKLTTPTSQKQKAQPLSKATTAVGTPASDATMPPATIESIRSAIALAQTRRFSQKSAVEARRMPAKSNPFSKLAPIFIGNLLGPWGGNRGPGAEQGYDVIRKSPLILLDRYVATLGVFVYFGGNSPSLIPMTRELFRFLLALRYYVPTAAQLATLPSGVQQPKVAPPKPLASGKGSLTDDQFGTMYNGSSSISAPSSIVQLQQAGSTTGAQVSEAGSRLHALQTISSSSDSGSSSQSSFRPRIPGYQLSPSLVQTILFDILILMNPPSGTLSDELFVMEFAQDLAETQAWAAELWDHPLDGEEKTRITYTHGESLVRVLLGIDCIQPGLLTILLDKIVGYLEDDEDLPTPKLILNQLKWLENVVEPEQLSSKLLEVINMTPLSVQRDVIVFIPEIIPDSEHKAVVSGFLEIMESTSSLVVPILDALSNLNLQVTMLRNARNQVVEKLESADLEDLPVVIKFLLQTVDPETVEDVITEIRQKLDFKSIRNLQTNGRSADNWKHSSQAQTPEVLILDALRSGIRYQKFVASTWFKMLQSLTKSTRFKRKVEALVHKKVIEGALTRRLLEDVLTMHGGALRESSQSFPIVSRTACTLYTYAFYIFDAYYRQEIIGSLLVHIGSGSKVEIDSSLAVLHTIVQVARQSLNEYSAFIKGVLDYLDNLSPEQIRKFFLVLGLLAREDEASGNTSNLMTDLNITIRKQISNPVERYRKMGVMGAISIVEAFGTMEYASNQGAGSSSQTANHRQAEYDPLLKVSVQYLNMIRDACQKSPACLALTFDELASLISSKVLDRKLELWIREEFSDQFAATFVCEVKEEMRLLPSRKTTLERWMNLDGKEAELTIKIIPTLCADYTAPDSQSGSMENTPESIVYLCSLFKLLQATEKCLGENGLDDIDGLLGCSITMFKQEYVENITELEQILRHILKAAPGFRPLEAIGMSSEESSRAATRRLADPMVFRSNAFKGKEAVRSSEPSSQFSTSTQPTLLCSSNSSEIVTYESLAPFLRELEMDVFNVLRVHDTITRDVMDEHQDPDGEKVQLNYLQLEFLLKDLQRKVDLKLGASPSTIGKKGSTTMMSNRLLDRMSSSDFVHHLLRIIPHLSVKIGLMLETISKEDTMEEDPADMSTVKDCLLIALHILIVILSWNELQSNDQKEIRLEILKSLAMDQPLEDKKMKIQESTNLSMVAAEAFEVIVKWGPMMPSFDSAASWLEVLSKILALVPQNPTTWEQASSMATQILSADWPNAKSIKPDRLAYVLGEQISKSGDPMAKIKEYVSETLPDFLDGNNVGEDGENNYPLLTSNTFTTYTKVLHIQLSQLVSRFTEVDFDDTNLAFEYVTDLTICFQKLAAFVKSNDKREVLSVTLRHSRTFMDQFSKRILPFMGRHFRGHQHKVVTIFKSHLQPATRSLQNVCGHAKAAKEKTLMTLVPSIKKTMETLIFEVKLMLENNGAGVAFWLGNLKHRNLAGQEISSQLPPESDDDDDDEEGLAEDQGEEMEIDELQDDVGISELSAAGRKRSRTTKRSQNDKASSSRKATKPRKMEDSESNPRKRSRATKRKVQAEEEERRVHSRSQITNSDVDSSEDEAHTSVLEAHHDDDDEQESDVLPEENDEDEQDEWYERRRQARNPYIDDAAEEDDGEDEEEEEEEEEDEEDQIIYEDDD
ncbi:Fanconi anemia group D2 protein [Actinomortierella wolfii]|nr:Fanconi anemia group D2 protein [Actinomortierella wolfii]